MLKRNIVVGVLFLFSLSVSASEAGLAKEAKKYKSLKELCLKSKEWSPMGRSKHFIKWDRRKESCKMRTSRHTKVAKEKYSSLAPYVFANSKPGNVFFKINGFSFRHYKKNNGYKLSLGNKNIQKDELNEIYATLYKKFKKTDFKTQKEVRSVEDEKASLRRTYEILYMSRGGLTSEGEKELNKDLRNATQKTLTWDETTFSNNGDIIVFNVTSIITPNNTEISGNISYTVN